MQESHESGGGQERCLKWFSSNKLPLVTLADQLTSGATGRSCDNLIHLMITIRPLALLATLLLPLGKSHAAEPFIEKQPLFTVGEDPAFNIYHIPGIVVTANGTVLAWCEARKGGGDWSDIRILLRRSTDHGKTWSAPKSIVDVPGPKQKNPFALRLKNVDKTQVTYNNPVLIADKDGTVHMVFCLEYERAFYQRSTDDGLTWSAPTEITATFDAFKKDYGWKVLATGPNHSIQLKTGRLVVPVWLSTGEGGNAHRPSVTATVYSDDAGKTWKRGAEVPQEGMQLNEVQVAETADGSLYLNSRRWRSGAPLRKVSWSQDGGATWAKATEDAALPEPVCQGSLLSATAGGKTTIFFLNPAGKNRANGTFRRSEDGGKTWAESTLLFPGPFAYSSMAQVGADVGVLYEPASNTIVLYRTITGTQLEGK